MDRKEAPAPDPLMADGLPRMEPYRRTGRLAERRFGQITERTVLYRGKNTRLEDSVKYVNVKAFRQTLDEKMAIDAAGTSGPNLGPLL